MAGSVNRNLPLTAEKAVGRKTSLWLSYPDWHQAVLRVDCRQTLPWDYFTFARHSGIMRLVYQALVVGDY
jgi:hypothetical protein